MAFLNQITKFSKDDLTPVQTVVTKHDGSKIVEKKGTEQCALLNDPQAIQCFRQFFVVDASDDHEAHQVCDRLFIGSHDAATNWDTLEKNNITCILNVAVYAENAFPERLTYKNVSMYDVGTYNIMQHFEECGYFIEKNLRDGHSVLVHCNAGISRSSTVIIAYLIRYQHMSLQKAMHLVRENRPVAQPNPGFMSQLKNYESSLRSEGSADTKS